MTIGYYRDYKQDAHYPFYYSCSLHGYYAHDVETNFSLFLNNDFKVNDWSVFATQIEVDVPLAKRSVSDPDHLSQLKLGRQMFSEGFDYLILDGVQAPLFWSPKGGLMPIAGYLQSPDPDQKQNTNTPMLGVVAWQNVASTLLRGGYSSRNSTLSERYVFGAVTHEFDSVGFRPSISTKGEWSATDFSFNQSRTDLSFIPFEFITAQIGYSDLNPRPISKIAATSFVYYLFSMHPTRSVSAALQYQHSPTAKYSIAAAHSQLESEFKNDRGDQQDAEADFQLITGRWVGFSVTHLISYGGEVYDFSSKYSHDFSDTSRWEVEYDLAYLEKIDGIHSWVHHVRTGLERQVADNTSAMVGVEGERNMYFQFDLRTVVYVNNFY